MRGYIKPTRQIAFVILLCLLTQAPSCPSQKDLDRMTKASGELAYDVGLVTDVITEAYNAKKISFEKKNEYAAALKKISAAGKKFNGLLIELDKKYPEGTVPPDTAQFLRENFREIAEPFRELLGGLNLFGLGGDKKVQELKKDVETVEEVLNKND